jgi:hypothetical protein
MLQVIRQPHHKIINILRNKPENLTKWCPTLDKVIPSLFQMMIRSRSCGTHKCVCQTNWSPPVPTPSHIAHRHASTPGTIHCAIYGGMGKFVVGANHRVSVPCVMNVGQWFRVASAVANESCSSPARQLIQTQLTRGTFNHLLLNGGVRDETVHHHLLLLTDTMRMIFGLQIEIDLGVPIRVVHIRPGSASSPPLVTTGGCIHQRRRRHSIIYS